MLFLREKEVLNLLSRETKAPSSPEKVEALDGFLLISGKNGALLAVSLAEEGTNKFI